MPRSGVPRSRVPRSRVPRSADCSDLCAFICPGLGMAEVPGAFPNMCVVAPL